MELTAQSSGLIKNIEATKTLTFAEKFSQLCVGLEGYRILLLCLFLLVQTAIFVPVTLLLSSFVDIGLGGVSVGLLAAGTVGVLVTNMAEASIKAIIFTFLVSAVSSLVIIAIHLSAL